MLDKDDKEVGQRKGEGKTATRRTHNLRPQGRQKASSHGKREGGGSQDLLFLTGQNGPMGKLFISKKGWEQGTNLHPEGARKWREVKKMGGTKVDQTAI